MILPATINNGSFDDDPTADKVRITFDQVKTNLQFICDIFDGIEKIEVISRVDYNALLTPTETTLYIVEESGFISIYKGTETTSSSNAPFVQSFLVADWVSNNFTVLSSTHGKGLHPSYIIKDSLNRVVDVSYVTINEFGDITLATDINFDGTIIIR